MMLEFNPEWRFAPPADGEHTNSRMPVPAINDIVIMIGKIATQGDRQTVLEHFKGHFCNAIGTTHIWSSSEGWAETDLERFMGDSAANAPMFIEAIYDGLMTLKAREPKWYVPGEKDLNKLFRQHNVGYEIREGKLLLKDAGIPDVHVESRTESLDEKSNRIISTSLLKADELLSTGDGKGAVLEILWLLETVSTAFRGISTESTTVEGKYFNTIVKDLKAAVHGSVLEKALDWATSLHGFLSSPTGGGARHGLDLKDGFEPTLSESRLFVNLSRSYIGFLLSEHFRMKRTT